jgi:hypothetical protein
MTDMEQSGGASAWTWIRLVVVTAVTGMVVLIASLVAALWFAGGERGWVITALLLGALGAGGTWLSVSPKWPLARQRAVIGVAAVCVLFAIFIAHVAPPTAGRLRAAIRDLEQPTWRLVDDSEAGNTMCFDTCTEVVRTYLVDASTEIVATSLRLPAGATDLRRDLGDIGLSLTIEAASPSRSTVTVTAEAES